MERGHDLDRAIQSVYAAACGEKPWTEALADAGGLVGASSSFMFSTHSDISPGAFLQAWNQSDEMLSGFASHWHTEDEWAHGARRNGFMTRGATVLGDELVSRERLLKSPFFADFCRHHGMEALVGVVLFDGTEQDPMPLSNVCWYRPPGHEHFDRAEKQIVQRLVPHFQRALRLQRRIGSLRSGAAREAYASTGTGLVLLDEACHVLEANDDALQFLGSLPTGHYRQQQLRSIGRRCSPGLREAIQASRTSPVRIVAMSASDPAVLFGATMVLVPGHQPSAMSSTMRECYALVIDVPRTGGAQLAQAVADLYGLTRAEVRVLAGLLDGRAAADIAADHGLSLATVRSQIGSVLLKTQCRNQVDLHVLVRNLRP